MNSSNLFELVSILGLCVCVYIYIPNTTEHVFLVYILIYKHMYISPTSIAPLYKAILKDDSVKMRGKPAIKDSNSNQVKNKFWDAMFNRQIPRRQ